MMRPEKMKQIKITVLQEDIDALITFLGKYGLMQFSYNDNEKQKSNNKNYEKNYIESIDKIKSAATYLGINLEDKICEKPESDDKTLSIICDSVSDLQTLEYNAVLEKERIANRMKALHGFEKVDVALDKIDKFSFLNLKIGRLENEKQNELKQNIGGRALVLPIGGNEVLVASSKSNSLEVDSELKDKNWSSLQTDDSVSPLASITEMQIRSEQIEQNLLSYSTQKAEYAKTYSAALNNLYSSYVMLNSIDEIKSHLVSTETAFFLCGWIPAKRINEFLNTLSQITNGRVACSTFDTWEVESVRSGKEKIPVSIKHGKFAKAFEPLVFSYGAPLYGSIDPTIFTAIFFTLLFSIMFGDVGQGFCLLLLGFLADNKNIKFFNSYRNFSAPLKIVGVAAMVTGFLYGSVFSNEEILEAPTEAFTFWLSQTSIGQFFNIKESAHILNLMPQKDNMTRIFYFFYFTLGIGFILNSIGLIFNVINNLTMRRFEKAILSKNGIVGIIFFWYAVSIAIRAVIQGNSFKFTFADGTVLGSSLILIAFGHLIWCVFTGKKNIFKEGFFVVFMESIVEIIETVSGYFSNTVSYLRVGAFALSHAVLSFIIFTMADKINSAFLGGLWSAIIIIFGNLLIIVLEGMIVAIQVVRLEYYEFFSKFFTDTGKKFTPFKFNKDK